MYKRTDMKEWPIFKSSEVRLSVKLGHLFIGTNVIKHFCLDQAIWDLGTLLSRLAFRPLFFSIDVFVRDLFWIMFLGFGNLSITVTITANNARLFSKMIRVFEVTACSSKK